MRTRHPAARRAKWIRPNASQATLLEDFDFGTYIGISQYQPAISNDGMRLLYRRMNTTTHAWEAVVRDYAAGATTVAELCAAEHLLFAGLLVTDINSQNSLLLVKGDAEVIARISYPHVEKDEIFDLQGIVSRKKQLIPYLTSLLKEMQAEGAIPAAKRS